LEPQPTTSRQQTCKVGQCGRPRYYSSGLCTMHYKRLRRSDRLELDRPVDTRDGEDWVDVPGLEGRYQASSLGRLRWVGPVIGKAYPLKIVTGHANQDGYYQLRPYPRPDRRQIRVHQLIALAFLGPCPDGLEVNHIDGDRTNNAPNNLEYVTHADNVRHSWALGNCERRGEANGRAKVSEAAVQAIRTLHADGVPRKALADSFGVSSGHINAIVSRRAWSHTR